MNRLPAVLATAALLGLVTAGPSAAAPPAFTAVASSSSINVTAKLPNTCAAATERAERALAELEVPQPWPWIIEWECGPNHYRGHALSTTKSLLIWPEEHTTQLGVQLTLTHELAHAWDWEVLTEADRESWRAERGLSVEQPWYVDDSGALDWPEWIAYPAEDFAESFTWCWFGTAAITLAGEVPFDPPTPDQCELIWTWAQVAPPA